MGSKQCHRTKDVKCDQCLTNYSILVLSHVEYFFNNFIIEIKKDESVTTESVPNKQAFQGKPSTFDNTPTR